MNHLRLAFLVVAAQTVCGHAGADAARVAKKVEPAMVYILTTVEQGRRSGSGFIVSSDGYIATNHHVVQLHLQAKAKLTVWISGDKPDLRRSAKVVKVFPKLDLAIIKIEATKLKPVRLSGAGSNWPKKGGTIYAMGFPAAAARFGSKLEPSITSGIVSRKIFGSWTPVGPKFSIIQHTAPSNPGNSGGPIVNPCGEVTGINTRRELAYVVLPGGMPSRSGSPRSRCSCTCHRATFPSMAMGCSLLQACAACARLSP